MRHLYGIAAFTSSPWGNFGLTQVRGNGGVGVVVGENILLRVALLTHHRRSGLAQANAMSRAIPFKNESVAGPPNGV